MYRYVNYVNEYGRIMQFNKNKDICIHRWYPFVEGYSKEFIEAIVNEQTQKVESCLEPFSGSGTTALELSIKGISCISFFLNKLEETKKKENQLANDIDQSIKSVFINFSKIFYKYAYCLCC